MEESLKYYNKPRPEMAKLIPDNCSRVLEIGCGEGYFSGHFDKDTEYWGIEPVSDVANNAQQRLFKVINATFDDAYKDIPDSYFDLIVCNDVIEHMRDHESFLDAIKNKLVNGGYMVGSLPNVRYAVNLYNLIIKKDWRYERDGILDRTHLRFFTKKSIIKLFEEHGYIIEKISGINSIVRTAHNTSQLFTNGLIHLLRALTLNYYEDIRFLQFAFRIKISK